MRWYGVPFFGLVTICSSGALAGASGTSERAAGPTQDAALVPRAAPAQDDMPQKSPKIMCSWLAYDVRNFMCGDPPMSEVKKRCDKKATEVRGEKTECACTDDQDFIRDVCD